MFNYKNLTHYNIKRTTISEYKFTTPISNLNNVTAIKHQARAKAAVLKMLKYTENGKVNN